MLAASRRPNVAYKVVFSSHARQDLLDIYDYIADHSCPERALGYSERIQDFCRGLATFPARGRCRNDVRRGLRVIGFEKRVTIAFHLDGTKVIIDRLLYGGRSFDDMFDA